VPDPKAATLAEGHGHQQQGHQKQGHSQKGIAHSGPMVRSSRSRTRHDGDVRGDLITTICTQVISYLLSMLHLFHAKTFHANKHLQALTSTEVGATQAGPLRLATG